MPDFSNQKLNTGLARIMRRKGVTTDLPPATDVWTDFLLAVNSCLESYEKNRDLLDASAKISSGRLRRLYEQLKIESSLRLADSERHQLELESDVQKRTADLWDAQRELEEINKRLRHDATHDSLTGVFNRSYFIKELNRRFEICRSSSWKNHIAVFYVDLDKFKRINDALGHEVGDQLLIAFAERMRGVLNPGDCLARLGGDEFTILSTLIELTDEKKLADRIVAEFETPFQCGGMEVAIQASVGSVVANENHAVAQEMMRDADIAMYRAKKKSSPFISFDQQMFDDVQESLTLERELKIAISERQFIVNYQPIVDIRNNQICSTESLARWDHPERGTLSPFKFINIAEESGCIASIDRIIFEETCRTLRDWFDNSIVPADHKVNVNFSSGQLERFDSIPFLLKTMEKYNLESSQIIIEILESHLLEDTGQASQNINDLSNLGFEIYIDDFGTGYSSLSYLAKYPIDGLKIDRIFVRDAEEKPENQELIRSIVAMAAALNVKVVIEGVETIEQLKLVNDLGCHIVQGYVFSMPMDEQVTTGYLNFNSHLEITQELDCLKSIDCIDMPKAFNSNLMR